MLRSLVLLSALLLTHGPCRSQNAPAIHQSADFDTVFDWQQPLDFSLEKLTTDWERDGFSSSPLYVLQEEGDQQILRIGRHPYANVACDLTAVGGSLHVEEGALHLTEDEVRLIELSFSESPATIESALTALWPDTAPTRLSVRLSPTATAQFITWKLGPATAVLTVGAGQVASLRIGDTAARSALAYLPAGDALIVGADLDFLVQGDTTWTLTPDDLDQRFQLPNRAKPLHFEWLNADRTRARFTRSPFSNVLVGLSLFDGKIAVEEANLDFEDGHLVRATLSVYNRGDAGPLTVPEFEKLIQTCGRELGQTVGVVPKQRPTERNTAVRTLGWQWDGPETIAQMDHNDIAKGSSGTTSDQPEFLRLKLASPGGKDWNLGVTRVGESSTTVSRDSLLKNVQKDTNGDVLIRGVPMVDQGAKGYCVVASCQRLFEYYHIPCDQHELAQLVGTTAERGTSSLAMEEGLDKIDSQFKTRFKALIGTRMDRRDRERLDEKRFTKMLADSINAGVPLLWTLQLGRAEEIPPLPGDGQISGGHMRMIIGYNEKQGRLYFTDSWGAGHEKKAMTLADAFRVTDGLYTLVPRTY